MHPKLLAISLFGAALLVVGFAAQSMLDTSSMELWYQHGAYITTPAAVTQSEALIDKAAAAGYTGVLFWDSSFHMMSNPDWGPDVINRLKEVLNYAHGKRLKVVAEAAPYGWSNDVLAANPNWAEAQRVIGARLQVQPDGRTLKLKNGLPPFVNANFSEGQTGWFDLGDPNITIVKDARGGNAALTIANPAGNARIRQKIAVEPWRQYHLSFFYKAVGAQVRSASAVVYDGSSLDKERFNVSLKPSDNWEQLDYVFNSQDSHELLLYLGVWGGAQGTVQFSDIEMEETGPIWIAHREGAPFKLYDPNDASTVYQLGADYNEVIDPGMLPHRPCFENYYHTPPAFTLPASTHLKPGQIVAADYYAATPLTIDHQMGMCMTDPGLFRWLTKNAETIGKALPPESELLLYYDEMRHGNSCFSCKQMNMTPGELLAWNFGKTYGIYHAAIPSAGIWVWSDMFDPNHNAHDKMYYVEGSFAGSWKGLPPEVSIMNWNLDNLRNSLTWFSGLKPEQPVAYRQLIAGFYDRADAAAEARTEVSQALGIPGIRGLMYTTWSGNYSQLQAFADAARAAWPDYVKSVRK